MVQNNAEIVAKKNRKQIEKEIEAAIFAAKNSGWNKLTQEEVNKALDELRGREQLTDQPKDGQ